MDTPADSIDTGTTAADRAEPPAGGATPGPASQGRIRFEETSSDLEEARAGFEHTYSSSGWRALPTELQFRYRHVGAGTETITLRSTTFYGALDGAHESTDEYIVDWLKSGTGLLDRGRDDVAVGRGIPRLHPTDRPYEFAYADFEQNLVHLNRRFVDELAAEHEGGEPTPLRFDHTATISGEATQRWWSTVDYAANHFLRSDGASNTLLDTEVARLLAAAFIDLFPHEPAERWPAVLTPGMRHARAAADYMQANAHLPISSTDIAAAANVSLRTLQEAFQRHFGVSPSVYLRHVRLERVHAALETADPSITTVADIARSWGFGHLGRFSAAYAERYGEYPSQTLQR